MSQTPPEQSSQINTRITNLLQRGGLDTVDNCKAVIANAANAGVITSALVKLCRVSSKKLLTQDNFNVVIASGVNANDAASILVNLYYVDLLTLNNCNNIISNKNHLPTIAKAIEETEDLYDPECRTAILTQIGFDAIISDVENARSMVSAWRELYDAELLSPRNYQAVLAGAANARWIASLIKTLHSVKLLNQANRDALIANQVNIRGIGNSIEVLQHSGTERLTQTNFNKIIDNAVDSTDIARALRLLHSAKLLTQDNFDKLIANVVDIRNIANALEHLGSFELSKQDNFDTIITQRANAECFARAIQELHDAKIPPFGNRKVIIAAGENARKMASALIALYRGRLLTVPNRDMLVAVAAEIKRVAIALSHLERATLLTQTNFNAMVSALSHGVVRNEPDNGILAPLTMHPTQETFDRCIMQATFRQIQYVFLQGIGPGVRQTGDTGRTNAKACLHLFQIIIQSYLDRLITDTEKFTLSNCNANLWQSMQNVRNARLEHSRQTQVADTSLTTQEAPAHQQ